ncbi:hypothetical protein DPX16_20254 [Anabarilius grahami]|uniref:Uncharacterized protein n=1 Tax=Anabarilius grahami TaxID=495550 RepID=A0A3N0XEA7_ANAGA|nr:hypothetical protein DPX16_20254 [Anabarilius grahami]
MTRPAPEGENENRAQNLRAATWSLKHLLAGEKEERDGRERETEMDIWRRMGPIIPLCQPSGNQVDSRGNTVKGADETTLRNSTTTTFQLNCGMDFPSHRTLAMHRYHWRPSEVNTERIAAFSTRTVRRSVHDPGVLKTFSAALMGARPQMGGDRFFQWQELHISFFLSAVNK